MDFAASTDEIKKNAARNSATARHFHSIRLYIVAPIDNNYGMVRM
jgi:hypothetical protein